uniref:Replication-associated protein n=1 Tax=Plant associated genomovirus 5 TaxID=2584399 RepID=A0A4Y5QCK4_9VIRU|nr:Replication-associated protein [Plant associated genomovirus 5]
MTFRFAAKYGLLTYAQSDGLDPFRIVNLLSELGAECIVGKEHRADGGTHYHAFFMFSRKFQSRNARIFDIDTYHPNILRGRKSPEQMYDYATKDGDVVAGGLERPSGTQSSSDTDSFWGNVFDAETREETLRVARESSVSLLGRYYFQVRAIAESKAVQNPLDYVSPPELEWKLRSYPELNDWCETHLGRRGNRPKSLILVGPSRTGKTSWARSLGSHFYFGGNFNMDQLSYDNEDVNYAVFDDIHSLKFFPMWKFWMGAQDTFTVTDKYKGKLTFNWGRPVIWCNNRDPRADPDADSDWIDANCIVVYVPAEEPLISHANRE